MTDTITTRVVSELDEFQALADVWSELQRQCGKQNSPFLTHERLYSWWKHFGKDKHLNILVIEKGNQVIGIVPLMTVVYRRLCFTFRVLETIEAATCNYIGIIPIDNLNEVMPFVVSHFRNMLHTHLAIKLRLVPEDSAVLEYLSHDGNLSSRGVSINIQPVTKAPYIELPESWQEFDRSISRNLRSVLRRGSRKLEASNELEFGTYTLETLDAGLEEFFAIHERRWQRVGKDHPFYSKTNRAFYRDFLRRFLENGWLRFSYLTAENNVISSTICFIYNNKFWYSAVARNPDFPQYPVGFIHLEHLVTWAIERQLFEFDLMHGEQPYKYRWAKKSRKYLQITITGRGLFSKLYKRRLNTGLFQSRRGK